MIWEPRADAPELDLERSAFMDRNDLTSLTFYRLLRSLPARTFCPRRSGLKDIPLLVKSPVYFNFHAVGVNLLTIKR